MRTPTCCGHGPHNNTQRMRRGGGRPSPDNGTDGTSSAHGSCAEGAGGLGLGNISTYNYRRDYFISGGTSRRAAEPEFEQTAHIRWKRDYGDYGEDEEDVERHAKVVRKLLPQGFIIRQPLKIVAGPHNAGPMDYVCRVSLAFEAECLYLLIWDAQRLEKRTKGKYEVAKAKVNQQQCGVDWVLSEIEKIKEEQETTAGVGSSGKTGSSKKRRSVDDTDALQDVVELRLRKRRRMGKMDDTIDKTDDTEEVPASRSNILSQPRRSKRRKPSTDKQEEKGVPEPRSKRRKMASTSDGTGSVLQASGVLAISAVTTTITTTIHTSSSLCRWRPKRMITPHRVEAAAAPEPRGERIKTLRPRITGKAATISASTDSRRHGAARYTRREPETLAFLAAQRELPSFDIPPASRDSLLTENAKPNVGV